MGKYVLGGLALALACSPLVSTLPAAAAPAARLAASQASINPNQDGVNPANSTLTGISCVGGSFCMAVGWTFEGEDQSVQISTWSTLAEVWNGSNWTVIPTPATTGGSAKLLAVACSTSTSCEAVGYDSGTQLAFGESWDGHQWHLQATPNPGGSDTFSSLNGITCASTTSCTAVGYLVVFSPSYSSGPVVEQWNGTDWTIQPSAPATGGDFEAIACTTAVACTAVGSGQGSDIAERWNGNAWVLQQMPSEGNVDPSLAAVSCPTATFCMAVGSDLGFSSGGDTAIATSLIWNGTTWSQSVPLQPSGATTTTFNAVSCASATACVALGGSDKTGPLVESWNGVRWVRQSAPDRPAARVTGQEVTAVNAVACPNRPTCIAVGYLNQNSLTTNALGLISTGRGWENQAMAEPDNASTMLEAIACPASKECVAVGRLNTPTFTAPIAETHKYGTWSIQAMPWPANVGGAWMTGIACPSADDCIAVGDYSYGGGAEEDPNILPFADRWNGATWTILPSLPVPRGQVNSGLTGIACAGVNRCFAVGDSVGIFETLLIESWNGSSWSMQPGTMTPGAFNSWLGAVSCASATLCFASGYEGHTQGPMTVLVEGWDGSAWTAQPAPSRFQGGLTGVSCASPVFCMATGDIINAGPGIGPSALEWNGASWSLVPTPGPAGNANTLSVVSCFSATMCMAVGGSAPNRAEEWNGVSWTSVMTLQAVGAIATDLVSVACPHQAVCTAVGAENPNVAFVPWRTVAEVWQAQRWLMERTPNAT